MHPAAKNFLETAMLRGLEYIVQQLDGETQKDRQIMIYVDIGAQFSIEKPLIERMMTSPEKYMEPFAIEVGARILANEQRLVDEYEK